MPARCIDHDPSTFSRAARLTGIITGAAARYADRTSAGKSMTSAPPGAVGRPRLGHAISRTVYADRSATTTLSGAVSGSTSRVTNCPRASNAAPLPYPPAPGYRRFGRLIPRVELSNRRSLRWLRSNPQSLGIILWIRVSSDRQRTAINTTLPPAYFFGIQI